MSGLAYLAAALVLGGVFIGYAVRLYRRYSDALARRDVPLFDRLPRGAVFGAAASITIGGVDGADALRRCLRRHSR